MTRAERNTIFTINYLVLITSIIYFIAKYFLAIEGEWGPETHPLTIIFQKVHVLTVPFLIFAVGMIFSNHVWKRIESGYKKSRTSGIFLLVLLVLMSLTGYLIQVVDGQVFREYSAYLHIAVSVIWSVVFSYHHISSNRKRA
ncbi:hypothetical protein [Halobacteriovorax sp. DPLXC-1]|uniref:hypothetical protein n=1 Tax=unclassified Halobacteriovorax TaxID=2639665 RepID=UPI002FF322E2